MLVGLRDRISSKLCFGCDIELVMSGAQKVLLHPYRGMTHSTILSLLNVPILLTHSLPSQIRGHRNHILRAYTQIDVAVCCMCEHIRGSVKLILPALAVFGLSEQLLLPHY